MGIKEFLKRVVLHWIEEYLLPCGNILKYLKRGWVSSDDILFNSAIHLFLWATRGSIKSPSFVPTILSAFFLIFTVSFLNPSPQLSNHTLTAYNKTLDINEL